MSRNKDFHFGNLTSNYLGLRSGWSYRPTNPRSAWLTTYADSHTPSVAILLLVLLLLLLLGDHSDGSGRAMREIASRQNYTVASGPDSTSQDDGYTLRRFTHGRCKVENFFYTSISVLKDALDLDRSSTSARES